MNKEFIAADDGGMKTGGKNEIKAPPPWSLGILVSSSIYERGEDEA